LMRSPRNCEMVTLLERLKSHRDILAATHRRPRTSYNPLLDLLPIPAPDALSTPTRQVQRLAHTTILPMSLEKAVAWSCDSR